MNYLRAIGFGIVLWVVVFVVLSILFFAPFLEEKTGWQYGIFWVLLIPITLFAAKWYFQDKINPTPARGLALGIIGVIVALILDMIITVPLFVAIDIPYLQVLSPFFGDWKLYIGLVEIVVLCLVAGSEFDQKNWQKLLRSSKKA